MVNHSVTRETWNPEKDPQSLVKSLRQLYLRTNHQQVEPSATHHADPPKEVASFTRLDKGQVASFQVMSTVLHQNLT